MTQMADDLQNRQSTRLSTSEAEDVQAQRPAITAGPAPPTKAIGRGQNRSAFWLNDQLTSERKTLCQAYHFWCHYQKRA